MRIDFVCATNLPHHKEAAALARRGFAVAGIDSSEVAFGNPETSQICATWGWTVGRALRGQGKDVLVFEQAHYGNRAAGYAIGWNGINGDAIYPKAPDLSRWTRRHMLDYQARKSYGEDQNLAVIAGQVSTDSATADVNLPNWYRQAAETLKGFGFEVVFCPHPVSGESYGIDENPRSTTEAPATVTTAPFRHFLMREETRVVCAYSSAALTEAALWGIPVIAGSPRAMAWRVANPRGAFWQASPMILRPELPARADWLADLAWSQWTLAEVKAGAFVQPLLSALNGRSRPFSLSGPAARPSAGAAGPEVVYCP